MMAPLHQCSVPVYVVITKGNRMSQPANLSHSLPKILMMGLFNWPVKI